MWKVFLAIYLAMVVIAGLTNISIVGYTIISCVFAGLASLFLILDWSGRWPRP